MGAALSESAALLLLRGKAGRCEAPPGAIADAVNSLVDALHFPASATINSQARSPHNPCPSAGPDSGKGWAGTACPVSTVLVCA